MAPICLFVFNRYDTTQRMLSSLLKCPECSMSDLHVFMDGARNEKEESAVEKVRSLFKDLNGFKSIHTYHALTNKGLAKSIIEGVSKILQSHEIVIVLEDDLVVSHDFLGFMNNALELYQSRHDIWSISGYTPKLYELEKYRQDGVFLVPRAQCWGWGTWRDRWETVDWDILDYPELKKNKNAQKAFDQGGNDLFKTLQMERCGRIESWAIRWAYAASKQHCWTLNPMQSKVQNIGMENSDSHAGWNDKRHYVELSNEQTVLDPSVQPNPTLITAFKKHHNLGLISRIGYFMRLHNLGYHFVKGLLQRKKMKSSMEDRWKVDER